MSVHNVCKSKISFTELYEFIRHIHECQFNFVKLYIGFRCFKNCKQYRKEF